MPAVTRTKTGRYFFENGRVWREAVGSGVRPRLVGRWVGPYPLEARPTPDAVRDLARGRPLPKVSANRVAGFDVTFTWSKSVSLWAYGLTPPSRWHERTEVFADIVAKVMDPRLAAVKIGLGAGGRDKRAADAVGVLFNHTRSFLGLPHGHSHVFVPNVAGTVDGHYGSIRNAREVLFREQGVMRAEAHKRLDDHLQAKGYETVRVGNTVGLKGVPDRMVRELSPAREAMEEARATTRMEGPKAGDFLAWAARRMAGPPAPKTPAEMHVHCLSVARKYGVTLDALKRAPDPDRVEKGPYAAYEAALEARDHCGRKYGTFTEGQFREELYLRGIGRPATFDDLRTTGDHFLKSRGVAGIARVTGPGPAHEARYTTREGERVTREAERPYAREAWADLGKAVKGLGRAALVATAKKATEVVNNLAEAVNPRPRVLRVKGDQLEGFLRQYRPAPRVLAHAKAAVAALLAHGNPHERAAAAERVYADLRSFDRLRKNTVVVVSRSERAAARELHLLAKVATRDGGSVVLAERVADRSRRGRGRPPHGMPRDKARRHGRGAADPSPWKYQFRGHGREYER